MKFRLKYPPIPPNMPQFAEEIVIAAKEINNVVLDYSVESLQSVDAILGSMHANGIKLEAVADTVFGFGAYVGEVLVKHAQGEWVLDVRLDSELPVVRLKAKSALCHPIGVCLKRVQTGPSESLVAFYRQFVASPA